MPIRNNTQNNTSTLMGNSKRTTKHKGGRGSGDKRQTRTHGGVYTMWMSSCLEWYYKTALQGNWLQKGGNEDWHKG